MQAIIVLIIIGVVIFCVITFWPFLLGAFVIYLVWQVIKAIQLQKRAQALRIATTAPRPPISAIRATFLPVATEEPAKPAVASLPLPVPSSENSQVSVKATVNPEAQADADPMEIDSPMTSKQLKKLRDEIQNAENISRVKDLYKKLIAKLKDDKTTLTCELWRSLEQEVGYLDKAQQIDLAQRRTKVHNLLSDILKQLPPEQTEALSHPSLNLPSFESASTSHSAPSPVPLSNKFEVSRPNGLQIEVDRLQRENATLQNRLTTLTSVGRSGIDDAHLTKIKEDVISLTQHLLDQRSLLTSEKARTLALETQLIQAHKQLQEQLEKPDATQMRQRRPTSGKAAFRYLELAQSQSSALNSFTAGLCECAHAVWSGPIEQAAQAGNVTALKEQMAVIDRVFEQPPSAALLDADSLPMVYNIAALQQSLGNALKELGVEPIQPAESEPFQAALHRSPEGLLVWVSDRALGDTIEAVVKPGLAYRGQALRPALVRRRVCVTVPEPDQSPDPAQGTPKDLIRDLLQSR